MRERAIVELDKLHGSEFFLKISEGMKAVYENATTILIYARYLKEKELTRGTRILYTVAEEESAKYLILLDAVRCPRKDNMLVKHLKHFNNHLAKGIYVECYWWRPATYKNLQEYIESSREYYYLDGPNDVNYIVYNKILRKREELFYVDYVDFTEDGEDNRWVSPQRFDNYNLGFSLSPSIIDLIQALDTVGFSEPEALKIIADKWRNIEIEDDLHITKLQDFICMTLAELEVNSLLKRQDKKLINLIIDRWFYPLYLLDLKAKNVSKEELHKIQDSWSPL